jgi:zinc finger protein
MADTHQEEKPDGAAFDDFFDSIGNKAEHLSTGNSKSAGDNPATANGTNLATATPDAKADDDEPKIVDEIESLCMNCHENVNTNY